MYGYLLKVQALADTMNLYHRKGDADMNDDPQPEPPQILEPEAKKDDKAPTIAGYKPEDLLTAPLKPPEPAKAESRSATMNSSVRFFMAFGTLLALIGIILIVSSFLIIGMIVMIVGALAVAAGVFVPLKEQGK